MNRDFPISAYIHGWPRSPFATGSIPWEIVGKLEELIQATQTALTVEYRIDNGFAIHPSATIEPGAILKGFGIIGPRCLVAAGAYLRGGVYLDADCVIGPGSEIKTTIMFANSRIAHFNFVGDSILGADVNFEAGAVIANYRNELPGTNIRIVIDNEMVDTGVSEFGSLIGDHARIGANAVLTPGRAIAANDGWSPTIDRSIFVYLMRFRKKNLPQPVHKVGERKIRFA